MQKQIDKIPLKSTVFLTKHFAAGKGRKFYANGGKTEPRRGRDAPEPLIFMENRGKCTKAEGQNCDILPLKRGVQIGYNTVTKSNKAIVCVV